MPDRNIDHQIGFLITSAPVQATLAVIAYLFGGNLVAARVLACLYGMTVITKIVALNRQYLIECGMEANSREVIQCVLSKRAWRMGYVQWRELEDGVIKRLLIYVLILLTAHQLGDYKTTIPILSYTIDFLMMVEVRAILGNLGDSGIQLAATIHKMIDDLVVLRIRSLLTTILNWLGGGGGPGSYMPPGNLPPNRPPPENSRNRPTKD